MADLDSLRKLDGNGYLLEAAKMLAMVPEWEAKPGKLKRGVAEQCARISRYLVKGYVQAEGLPDNAKHDLIREIQPAMQDMKSAVEAGRQVRDNSVPVTQIAENDLVQLSGLPSGPAISQQDPAFDQFVRDLNTWHLELAETVDAMRYVLRHADFDQVEMLGSVAHILDGKAGEMVERCPFPK